MLDSAVRAAQASAAILFGVIVALQALVAIQLQTFAVYLMPTQDLAYVLATGCACWAAALSPA